MKRDVALKIDGMLSGVHGNLDCIVHYLKNNSTEAEYKVHSLSIARSMASLIDISNSLYRDYPDIVPDELQPPKGE